MLKIIRKKTLNAALDKNYRQYLTGHLQIPQPDLAFIESDIEIGISHYRKFTADKPHLHPVCTEHAFVLEGALKIRLLDGSGEEYLINAGDFFVLEPGQAYAAKNIAGTKILFIKSPGLNDKTLVEVDADTKKWLEEW